MSNFLDDEFQQMDEREFEEEAELGQAVSVEDPIRSLRLGGMVLVDRETTIARVIELFQVKGVACVLVTEGDKLVGIFTERDVVMKVTGKGLNLSRVRVDSYMTPSPEVLKIDDPIAFALNRMTDGGYRHVPIVDDRGKPVALVAILDIVEHLASYYSEEVLNLPPEPHRKPQERPEGG
ncbi:MAG: cyclic nucleotide-binding/CBS domain-containing protein [Fidelibacterota bacterium]